MPNIPELRKALEWVEAQAALPWQEREWHQTTWCGNVRENTATEETICGTTYCIAGWVAVQHGWQFVDVGSVTRLPFGGQIRDVDEVAQRILGITDDQAGDLFYSGNNVRVVRAMMEEIAGERL